ncbi:MAG: phosphate/phosphite/phosphonate ABC transporter substrate-binding protein [Acidimicrobiales bacterium]
MRRKNVRALVALLLALAVVGAACSDDATEASEPIEASETTEASGTTEAADTTEAGETGEEGDAATDGEAFDRTGWPESITFGAVPSEQAATLETSYAVTLEILEAELGVDIEFFQAADYAGIVEAQVAGTIDVAQYGPFSFIIAENNGADIQPVGVMTAGPDVEPGYRAYAVTQATNEEINGLADFAGRQVCFVDPGSTSGFLYPSSGLLAEGIDPQSGVTATFAGGHDASAISVANGTCEAGFAFDSMITSILIDSGDVTGVIDATGEGEDVGEEADANLKIVWKSPVIAGSPMAINNQLPQSFIDAFTEVMTTKVNEDWASENDFCELGSCRFSDEDIWGYTYRDTTFFDGVRQVCEETKSPACLEG